jgi:sarcosine oxidase
VIEFKIMSSFDVVIVGAGVMGTATALELTAQGCKVALVDQSNLPNPKGASIDHSKVFRFAYPDPFYVRLAVDSLNLWEMLEEESGQRLMTESGLVLLGVNDGSFEIDSHDALRGLGLETTLSRSQELVSRFSQFNPAAYKFAVYDPSGRILHAERCVKSMLDIARLRGVEIIDRARVLSIKRSDARSISIQIEGDREVFCDKAAVTAGPWTRMLLPELDQALSTTRQEVVYFEPPANVARMFEPTAFPMFIELSSGFYGFPIHRNGALKIANHHKAEVVDPYSFDESVGAGFIARCRAFFEEFIPALSKARAVETRVCLYNNTPDDDFVVDWHHELDGVLVVTGFSGHGFKFGPVIGKIAAQMLLSGHSSYDIKRFKISRLSA